MFWTVIAKRIIIVLEGIFFRPLATMLVMHMKVQPTTNPSVKAAICMKDVVESVVNVLTGSALINL
jgi:hypothetical protein